MRRNECENISAVVVVITFSSRETARKFYVLQNLLAMTSVNECWRITWPGLSWILVYEQMWNLQRGNNANNLTITMCEMWEECSNNGAACRHAKRKYGQSSKSAWEISLECVESCDWVGLGAWRCCCFNYFPCLPYRRHGKRKEKKRNHFQRILGTSNKTNMPVILLL